MTSKTTNKFSPEVRARAVRMVLDHASKHPSRWASVTSIAAKIGCTPQTLHDWVKKAEVDRGQRAGVPTAIATLNRQCHLTPSCGGFTPYRGENSGPGRDDRWTA